MTLTSIILWIASTAFGCYVTATLSLSTVGIVPVLIPTFVVIAASILNSRQPIPS